MKFILTSFAFFAMRMGINMKSVLLTIALFSSLSVWAQENTPTTLSVACEVAETADGETVSNLVEVIGTNDSHGTVKMFELQTFTQFSGMIALMGNNVVIHIYDNQSRYAFTTHADLTGQGHAYYQLILPSGEDLLRRVLSITCVKK